jgi:hypothetical protein
MTTMTVARSTFSRAVRIGLVALPPVLTATMMAAFIGLHRSLGYPLGYLAAFVVYWIGWCIAAPAFLLGGVRAIADLFEIRTPRLRKPWSLRALLLAWPLVPAFTFAFAPRIASASIGVIAASTVLGIVVGTTEEILWRGVYVRVFPGSTFMSVVYPSVGFAAWHLAPLAVRANRFPGGSVSFAGYALLLGLSYAWVARDSGTIRWCVFSHVLHDALGLGGFAYRD